MSIGKNISEYTGKALDVIKASPGYAVNLPRSVIGGIKKHPHVAAGAAATLGAGALQVGMNYTGLLSADSPLGDASRFVPYVANALACAELNVQRVRNQKGRELTFPERVTSYLYGSIAPLLLWEGWEDLGTREPLYSALNSGFGDLAQKDFPGKGSIVDIELATATTMGIEAVKEVAQYLSRLAKRRE